MEFVETPGIDGAEKTLHIWKEQITSSEAIYEAHPFRHDKLARLLGVVPKVTRGWGPREYLANLDARNLRFAPPIQSAQLQLPLRPRFQETPCSRC